MIAKNINLNEVLNQNGKFLKSRCLQRKSQNCWAFPKDSFPHCDFYDKGQVLLKLHTNKRGVSSRASSRELRVPGRQSAGRSHYRCTNLIHRASSIDPLLHANWAYQL